MTYNGFQYVVLYQPKDRTDPNGSRVTSIGRRSLEPKLPWNFLTFEDYIQTKDDGHNIISLGISGDGIIHMAWDMHGDEIHYRQSKVDAANTPYEFEWTKDLFGPVLTELEGEEKAFQFRELTYPRFQTLANGDMLLEFRCGRSGLGDCCIYRFCKDTHKWSEIGMYIKGVENNAYLHGFDYKNKTLHVTWTYRDYVDDRSEAAASHTTLQAGPNGPENNHDLHYMYSEDEGVTWYSTLGKKLSTPVDVSQNTLAVDIPKFSGIMNQEGQFVDAKNRVHVLGRQNGHYYHYFKRQDRVWEKRQIGDFSAVLFGARGKLLVKGDTVYGLLPLQDHKFVIVKSNIQDSGSQWTVAASFDKLDGEPLVDRYSEDIYILQREAPEENTGDGLANGKNIRHVVLLDVPNL